ncbi:MAG: hypothetical protein IPK16_19545 [Anaerolineales bacterium]|nr:hypothetical protein [Anaerolineales bacterium]
MTEALTLLVARSLTARFDPSMTQGRAAAIGFGVAATITLVVNLLLWRGLGVFFDQLWPSGYLFWIGLPGVLYMIATAAAMSRWIVMPAPRKV